MSHLRVRLNARHRPAVLQSFNRALSANLVVQRLNIGKGDETWGMFGLSLMRLGLREVRQVVRRSYVGQVVTRE